MRTHARPGRLWRWASEVGLGARLAVGGGREGLLRTALTAVGVALGVAVLLLSVSIPSMLAERRARTDARDDIHYGATDPERSDSTVLSLAIDDGYRGRAVRARFVQPEGAYPVLPPGVSAFPPAGSMLVSPALKELLESPGGAVLRERYPARIAGTIGRAGLAGPNELTLYSVRDDLAMGQQQVSRVERYGSTSVRQPLDPFLLLLVVVIFVVLLMPVAMFVAAATRFGGEQRDRRLAAVRLVGADAGMTRRIAAGEAVVSAALGVLVGAGFFLLGRQFVERFELSGLSVFAGDVHPTAGLAALIVVAVPLAALAMTLLALRRVVVEPLGVVRRATAATRRRVWWRLALPIAGAALLIPLAGTKGVNLNVWQAIGGVVLILLGVAILLPWIFERVVGALGGAGSLSWQLAVRRLQLAGGSSVRAVIAIAVAAAGTIALQMLFSAIEAEYTKPTNHDLSRAQAITYLTTTPQSSVHSAADIDAALRANHDVTAVSTYRRNYAKVTDDDYADVAIADCAVLREMATLPSCSDGDVFILDPGLAPGTAVELDEGAVLWSVPAGARPATARPDPYGDVHGGLLITPSAAPPAQPRTSYVSFIGGDLTGSDAQERLRNTTFAISPTMNLGLLTPVAVDSTFASIRRGLFAGATVVLVLVGLSLLVATLEQLRERRRTLAALVAFGTRRGTMSLSILWQTTVPVVLGLLLAAVLGLGLAAALLSILGVGIRFDWTSVATVGGIAGGVVLLVTAASLPALFRLMRPEGLRFE